MEKRFTSSILNFGPILTPHIFGITDEYVGWARNVSWDGLFLGHREMYIERSKISNVSVEDFLLWKTITITAISGEKIVVEHLSAADANEIMELL